MRTSKGRQSAVMLPGLASAVLMLLMVSPDDARAQITMGFRGGINFANEVFDPELFTSTRHGIVLGCAANVEIAYPFALELQPQYAQKGVISEGGPGVKTRTNFNYIELPVLLSLSYRVRPLMVYAFAGPNLGVLVSASFERTENGHTTKIDAKGDINDLDIAVDFGAGVGFDITPTTTIVGDIRYSNGFSTITIERSPNYEVTNRSRDVRIIVGIMFAL